MGRLNLGASVVVALFLAIVPAAAKPVTVDGTAVTGLASFQGADAPTGSDASDASGSPRAAANFEQAVFSALASLQFHGDGRAGRFPRLMAGPGNEAAMFWPAVMSSNRNLRENRTGNRSIDAPLHGALPLQSFALALFVPPDMVAMDAMHLPLRPAPPGLRETVSLIDFDGDAILGELTSSALMALPAPALLLLSAIGWLALGARGRATG